MVLLRTHGKNDKNICNDVENCVNRIQGDAYTKILIILLFFKGMV